MRKCTSKEVKRRHGENSRDEKMLCGGQELWKRGYCILYSIPIRLTTEPTIRKVILRLSACDCRHPPSFAQLPSQKICNYFATPAAADINTYLNTTPYRDDHTTARSFHCL